MDILWPFAKRFVAGKNLEQALPKIKEINNKNMWVTLDILGENVTNKEEPERFVQGYVDVVKTMAAEKIVGGISVKPTMMGMDIDMKLCRDHIATILTEAAKHDIFVRIDMEGSDYTDLTLDLVEDLHAEFPNTGIVLQAMLHRTEDDLKRMVEKGISIRLCKGAYKEPAEKALKKMKDIREAMKKLGVILMNDKNTRHALATHDEKLIAWYQEYAEENNIAKDSFEFQMLYGMIPSVQDRLAREGWTFRAYVPFGTHWFPYFYRRLRERKENIWFVLVNFFKK
jgi:proline dehydrogenase